MYSIHFFFQFGVVLIVQMVLEDLKRVIDIDFPEKDLDSLEAVSADCYYAHDSKHPKLYFFKIYE